MKCPNGISDHTYQPKRKGGVGNTIAAMKEFAGDIPILPSIRESEQFKRAIRTGKLLSELGYSDLEYPFEQIILALTHER